MTEPDRLAPGGRAILTRTLPIGEVSKEGRWVRFEATPEELRALEADLQVPAIHSLKAEVLVRHWGKGGVEATGQVAAAVTQNCVVTLEPIEQSFVEPIDIRFETETEALAIAKRAAEEAADEEDDTADIPDIYDGQTIPVGAIAEEFFALGLDPYPRKEGVEFTAESLGYSIGDPSENAFAVLGQLKPKE